MMSPERLEELLETYGSREERWPEDQRSEMRACLDAFPQLQRQLFEARDLDLMLDSYCPEDIDLQQRILDALPVSVADRLLNWLLPEVPGLWWRPAMAAALPMLLGLAIGMESQSLASIDVMTDWEEQERSLLLPLTGADWYE
ncbi:hypothetical protein R0135_09895 [Congregibacter variabilis]|uniref:Uncharacterized protein n=1 Tax=Congregibacter variabilis TaxID=3081200 RepID=A0ABZ0HXY3_9GAMM|nr:hypothetical protein R0135_09895 [Congregibacter sp. IMCC43200]